MSAIKPTPAAPPTRPATSARMAVHRDESRSSLNTFMTALPRHYDMQDRCLPPLPRRIGAETLAPPLRSPRVPHSEDPQHGTPVARALGSDRDRRADSPDPP